MHGKTNQAKSMSGHRLSRNVQAYSGFTWMISALQSSVAVAALENYSQWSTRLSAISRGAALTIFFPRVAAVIVLTATLLCLPSYLYILIPGPYRRIFKGEYSVRSKDHLLGTTGRLSEYLASGLLRF